MSARKLNQSGAVSMISVVIFAIIITIVATAYIRSVVTQQKNALDYDMGTRAYYAAESGVQDAVRSLSNNSTYQLNGKSDCQPADSGGSLGATAAYGVGYTCQIIIVTPSEVKGSVQPNAKNATIRLTPTTTPAPNGPYKLVVRWSSIWKPTQGCPVYDSSNSNCTPLYYPRDAEQPLFPSYGQWNASGDTSRPVHALLRVNIISVPKTGSFNRDQIKQRVVFMNPVTEENSTDALGGGYADFRIDNDLIEPQQTELVNNAECYPSDNVTGADFKEYSCKRTIRLQEGYNLNNQTLYARVSSVYRSTNFSLELTQDSGVPIAIRNGQAVIDVTGKAGDDVYRRVQQTVSLGGYFEDNQPDAALIAGEGICKLMSYTTVSSGYQQGDCDPLGPNE